MAWENETTGWLKIKEGETKEFTILKINEKQGGGRIQPIPGKTYYYEFETDAGTLTVNNLGLKNAMVEANVRAGDKIKVEYLVKGSLGKPSQFAVSVLEKVELDETDQTPF